MAIKIVKEDPAFIPISITMNTKEDLIFMVGCLNAAANSLRAAANSTPIRDPDYLSMIALADALRKEL